MSGKVKCTCGWSWNKSDSSAKDMYICHECGRDNSNNMKNGGWLDNYNDYEVSAPEGMIGDGLSNVGRNSSPAWGGQFQNGGKAPKYVESKNDPRYKAYQDSLSLYNKGYDATKDAIKDFGNKNISYNKAVGFTGPIKPSRLITVESDDKKEALYNYPVYKKPQQQVIVKDNNAHQYKTIHTGEGEGRFEPIQRQPIRAIKNIKPAGLVHSDLDIEAELPEIRTEVKHPKSWKYNKIEGGSEESGYINSPEDFEYYIKLKNLYEDKEHKDWLGTKNKIDITPQYQMGGNLPGAVGHMYARTGSPSKGPRRNQTDVTDASAQNGKEMQYYQEGLDWKPKTISKNGAWLDQYDVAQNGTKKEPEALATLRAIKEGKIKKENPYKNIKIKDERNEMVKSADNTRTASKPKITDLNKLNVRNQTEKEKAAEEAYQDKAIAEQRKATREKANANPLNKGLGFFDSKNQTRQNWEDSTAGLESKFRVSDTPNFFDDWLNPLNQIGGMAADLGAAPNQIVQQDSMMPLITAIGVPLLTGGLEGIGAKTTKQFVSNLANPFNIVPGYKSVEKSIGKALGTEEGLLSNAYKLNPNSGKLGRYNRIVGNNAIEDLNTSGLVRAGDRGGRSNMTIGNVSFNRKTPYPSFAEGVPAADNVYAQSIVNQGNKPYIISTNREFAPSTLGRHGKGSTMFPIDDTGKYLESFPASEVNVFEATKPHWLKGYKEVPKQEDGGIIKDDRGQWDHPGEITEIGSNEITMEGVPYDVLGISDTGDTKLMKPGKNYKFKGKKVTEYPMAKNGVNQQDQKTFEQLDQLTNFTNYNKPTIGGWLNKYN